MTRIRGRALGTVVLYATHEASHTGNCQYLSRMSYEEILLVTKANGDLVPFDAAKLRASMERAGADAQLSATIARTVEGKIQSGISTRKLYRMAFALLHKHSRPSAARYRLKQAIMDLGPSGFPFEQFVSRILAQDGYHTQVGMVVQGKCIAHEVDVLADKETHRYLVECKYHNTPGRICDVKVPLYIKARFDDIAESWKNEPGNGDRFHQGWVVTNTRFTGDALQYGRCAGLRMVGWDQPEKGSLKERIDRSGLYPLTCLASLTKAEKERLLADGLVLVRDLLAPSVDLSKYMIKAPRASTVLREAADLCVAKHGR